MKKKEYLPHIITVILMVVLIAFGLACATPPPPAPPNINPMTKAVADDVESYGGTINGFRFYVSTDVTLTKVDRDLGTNASATTVQETIVRNIIKLKADTKGRLFSGNVNEGLNVYFEPLKTEDAVPETFTFIEKAEQGDRFYFKYEEHRLTNIVKYGEVEYQVKWEGNEEPYLKYERTLDEETRERTLLGVD